MGSIKRTTQLAKYLRDLGEADAATHWDNLEGSRQLLESGQIIGPGDYVYEPAGNQDSWMAVGNVPCVVFISLRGALEYLGPEGDVIARDDTESMAAGYRTYCEANGLEWFDLSA